MQKRGYHDFSFKIFCLTVPKNFVGEHFCVSENFGYRKILCIREGGYHVSPSKTFVTQTEKFCWGTLRCFRKSGVLQNFMHKRGTSLNSAENFFSKSANKNCRRSLPCFETTLVSKIFKQRRGEVSRFCRKFLYLTGPKKFRQGTILCFRKILVGKRILWIREGGYHDFPSKSFCLTVPNYFTGEQFGVSENFFLSKIFTHKRGASRFCRSFYVSQCRKRP